MICLLGGPMRVGKSIIAARVAARSPVQVISTDDLRSTLAADAPELGAHADLDPTARYPLMEPLLDRLLALRMARGEPALIEGDAFSPAWAARFRDRAPGRVRVCFAGELSIARSTKLRHLREHTAVHGGWLADEPPETYRWAVGRIFAISREDEAACDRLGIAFFDMGVEFETSVERVVRFLAAPWPP